MNIKTHVTAAIVALVAATGFASSATAGLTNPGTVLVDGSARAAALASSPDARTDCRMTDVVVDIDSITPIPALQHMPGYGGDRRGQPFAWALMVLTGRALTGDAAARADAQSLLRTWAGAAAFEATEQHHDAYFPLKRLLVPTIVSYALIRDGLPVEDRAAIDGWLDRLIRKVDHQFGGSVDKNNHRYLTDAALMAWGALTGDEALYDKGIVRFRSALADARADGSLPLETRRGARALWYMRQAISNLVLMAEIAAQQGDDLYSMRVEGKRLDTLVGYLVNGLAYPGYVRRYAAFNHVPGPSADYARQDLGFLDTRGHGRHYMAWTIAYLRGAEGAFAARRLQSWLDKRLPEGPLIDEFVGGNASCFWGASS